MVGYMSVEERVARTSLELAGGRSSGVYRPVCGKVPSPTVFPASRRSAESSAWQAESAADGGLCA